MKMLLIHADDFEYKVREEAIKDPEKISESEKEGSMNNVLVAFCTIEKEDEGGLSQIADKAADSLEEVAGWVKTKNIMLYPYAHLSSSLGSKEVAIPLLKAMERILRDRGYNVKRSPFGWYKSFKISCKGHPLSELSRTISLTPVKEELKPAPKVLSEYLILEPDGKEYPISLDRIEECAVLDKYPLLREFILSEEVGRVPHKPPSHIRLMKKLELVDYEPASDIGHFRFYPKGALIKEILEKFATDLALKDLGAMRIETPLFYRLDQPDIAEHAAKFLQREYRIKVEDRELAVRFAGDFGLFRMMKEATISYKQLPIRVYELSPSFRLEQSGECVGLKRLRAFTMPDIHCFCKDLTEGMSECERLTEHYAKLADSMEIEYVVAFRAVKDFYEKNKAWFSRMLKLVRKPALIELLPEMKAYWVVKNEFQFIDAANSNAQLCTVQLDIEDSERYGIFYTAEDGSKRGCVIVHSSMGSIERWIYAILEHAERMRLKGQPPMLPVWLSPTQVRVIPVSKDYLDYAGKVAEEIRKSEIRVDVDDRDETVASKVRDAEMEWIPYIVVVGEREAKEGFVTVRIRGNGQEKLSIPQLIDKINEKIGRKPRSILPLPAFMSMRLKFI
jgi:threonyl-tRNA synthetase